MQAVVMGHFFGNLADEIAQRDFDETLPVRAGPDRFDLVEGAADDGIIAEPLLRTIPGSTRSAAAAVLRACSRSLKGGIIRDEKSLSE
jgi:hypothetical protein